jgi:acetolactate synthase-1/2/3 large subunit
MVGLGGVVPRAMRLKQAHQNLDTATLFRPVAKFSVEVDSETAIGEALANAFRAAEGPRPGAAFVGLPSDVMEADASDAILTPTAPVRYGSGPREAIREAARLIDRAHRPVLLLGMLASEPDAACAVREMLAATQIPAVATFQATGVLSRELLPLFGGRIGLFHNQPADRLLDDADLVVTIGYDPIEYDASLWNQGHRHAVVHIDAVPCDVDGDYVPTTEIIGDIAGSVAELTALVSRRSRGNCLLGGVIEEMNSIRALGTGKLGTPVHPLRLVADLQSVIANDVTLCLDVGSSYIWLARYLHVFQPRQMMISNGQQTLGVALPWAIAACLTRPDGKVVSVSGDGGFHFSSMELETAVRLGCNLVHVIWRDGHYDMVRFQEEMKYGRRSGTDFGPIDTVRFAESMGAKGFAIERAEDFLPVLRKAMTMSGPVLIDVPVDYSHNRALGAQVLPQALI